MLATASLPHVASAAVSCCSCSYIQSRFYRAPEVILGLPYGPPIDIWSLGCVLAELLTGHPLLPGEDEAEQLACIMEVLGLPHPSLLAGATRVKMFFDPGEFWKGRPGCCLKRARCGFPGRHECLHLSMHAPMVRRRLSAFMLP